MGYGRVSARLSVPSIAAAFRSISAAGARVQQQRAGSVDAVIRGGSTLTCQVHVALATKKRSPTISYMQVFLDSCLYFSNPLQIRLLLNIVYKLYLLHIYILFPSYLLS